jgi:hypothetical protein
MTFDDIELTEHKLTGARRFGYWIFFRDNRKQILQQGKKGRKDLINFFETKLGPLGENWNYQKLEYNSFIIKINQEKDFLFFLLKIGCR